MDYWDRAMLIRLTDRLAVHLNQLCDANHCETPQHDDTRELIRQAREWVWARDGRA